MFKLSNHTVILIVYLFFMGFLFQSCGDDTSYSTNHTEVYFEGFNDSRRVDYLVPEKDPFMSMQWHMNNTTQTAYALYNGKAGEDIKHDPVRNLKYTGLGVTIAVSDNGTEETHPDLRSRILTQLSRNYMQSGNWHGVSSDNKGSSSLMAHGTATVGLIAATDGNGIGVAGIAPRSRIAPFYYVGTPGSFAKDIDQQNGPFDIFNYSYGRSTCDFVQLPSAQIEQYKFGTTKLRNGLGAIYVKAAGNEYKAKLSDCASGLQGYYYGNANLEQDQSTPYLIVVGSVNASGVSSSYSSPGSSIWVSAYGGEFGQALPAVVTTDTTTCQKGMSSENEAYNDFDLGLYGNDDCNYTATMNGTSASAPMVSGAVAVLLEVNPRLSWRDIKYILAKTARKVDPNRGVSNHPDGANLFNHDYQAGWTRNAAGFYFHNWYGFGVVDLQSAVTMAENYKESDYLPNLSETDWAHNSGNLNLPIPDSDSQGVSHSIRVNTDLEIFSVQILFSLYHSYAGDVGIELTSPSGTKSILLNINSNLLETNITNGLLLSNAFLGESTRGDWTIKLIDGANSDQGTLTNWKINFFGTPKGTLASKSQVPRSEDQVITTQLINTSSTTEINSKENLFLRISNKHQEYLSKPGRLILDQIIKYPRNLHTKTLMLTSLKKNLKAKIKTRKIETEEKIVDVKFDDNEVLMLHQNEIPHYKEHAQYKICGKDVYVSLSEEITITKKGVLHLIKRPESHKKLKFINCNKEMAIFKDGDYIIKLGLQDHTYKIQIFFAEKSNFFTDGDIVLQETLDQEFNYNYRIKENIVTFPKGYSQLFTIQEKGLFNFNKQTGKYIIKTNTTTSITETIVNTSSPLLIVLNTEKVMSILQLGKAWEIKNNISVSEFIDIKLNEKEVEILIKLKDNSFNHLIIPLSDFHEVQ